MRNVSLIGSLDKHVAAKQKLAGIIDLGDRLEALSIGAPDQFSTFDNFLTLTSDEKTNNAALRNLLAAVDGPIDRLIRQLDGFEDRLNGLRKVREGKSFR